VTVVSVLCCEAELLVVLAVLDALNAFEKSEGWSDWHHFETIYTRTEALLNIPTPDPLTPIWIVQRKYYGDGERPRRARFHKYRRGPCYGHNPI
jgi:hypothetical protein